MTDSDRDRDYEILEYFKCNNWQCSGNSNHVDAQQGGFCEYNDKCECHMEGE